MNAKAVFFLLVIAPALAIILALLGVQTLSTNMLGWLLLMIGVVFAAGIVIVAYMRREAFWEARIKGDTAQAESGDRSFWLITSAMIVVFFLSPLEYMYIATHLPRNLWMESGGVGLFVSGMGLFVWARRTLGDNYSGHLLVKKGQRLIQTGPYRIVRHPAYAGYLLMALGLAIGYSSLAGTAAVLVALLPCMVYRIHVEDRLLAEHFGKEFDKYSLGTKRLIPGIW